MAERRYPLSGEIDVVTAPMLESKLLVLANGTSDDLVPVIDTFDFLTEDDKIKIFHENPARVIPALGKIR